MAGGTVDHRNNVEQVLIAQPAPGDFTITVTPGAIAQASQDYALVVTGQWQSAMRRMPMSGNDAGLVDAGATQPGTSPDAGSASGVPAVGMGSGGAAAPGTMMMMMAVPQAGAPAVVPPPSVPALGDMPAKHHSGCSIGAADSASANAALWSWLAVLYMIATRRRRSSTTN
jgi:hypothetical protein